MTRKSASIQGPVVPDGEIFSPVPWGEALHNPAGAARDRMQLQEIRKRAIPRVLSLEEHAMWMKSCA
jgi:hypothetical protein